MRSRVLRGIALLSSVAVFSVTGLNNIPFTESILRDDVNSIFNIGTTKVEAKSNQNVAIPKNPTVKKVYYRNKAVLLWENVEGATGYDIYVSDYKYGMYNKIASTQQRFYKLNNLERGKMMHVKVQAYKTVNGRTYKNKIKNVKSVRVVTGVAVGAKSYSPGSINIYWKPSENIDGYSVQYSTKKDFSNATRIKVKGKWNDHIDIYGLKENKKYYVRIKTYKEVGKKTVYSLWSHEKDVVTATKKDVTDANFKDTKGFFKDSVFFGDSVLQGFQIYVKNKGKGYLDNTTVMGVVSYSLTAALNDNAKVQPLYKGKKMSPQKITKLKNAKKVFLSFGINDLHGGWDSAGAYNKYVQVIDNIKKENPDVKIYVLSTTYAVKSNANGAKFTKCAKELNAKMQKYCMDTSYCDYIDVASYTASADGYLDENLCSDGYVHQVIPAYALWDKALRNYAYNNQK